MGRFFECDRKNRGLASQQVWHYKIYLKLYGFTSRSRLFHLCGDVTIAGEGLKKLGLARRSGPLSREGSLSCNTCYVRHGASVFPVSSEDRPFNRLLRHMKGCGGYILTRILKRSNLKVQIKYNSIKSFRSFP
jgi:hypothetical protein